MLDCTTVRQELSAYIDDELPSAERQEIEQHLAVCPSCFAEYIQLQATSAILRSLKEIEPPPGFKDRVKERLLKEGKRGIWQKALRRPWHSVAAAAAVLLLVAGAWGLLFDGGLARLPVDLTGPPTVAEKDVSISREAAEVQLFAGEAGEEEKDASTAALRKAPESDEEAVKDAEAAPQSNAPPAEKKEDRVYQVAITSWPEAAGETPPEAARDPEITARALMLQEEADSGGEGLVIEISITTEDVVQAQEAIESLAYRNGLGVTRREENGLTVLEMMVPVRLQRNVIEQLRGIGFVTGETVSDPETGDRINELSRLQEELLQQQSELNALIASGGPPEEAQKWEEELARIQAELARVQEEMGQLEQELPPSAIRIVLTD